MPQFVRVVDDQGQVHGVNVDHIVDIKPNAQADKVDIVTLADEPNRTITVAGTPKIWRDRIQKIIMAEG